MDEDSISPARRLDVGAGAPQCVSDDSVPAEATRPPAMAHEWPRYGSAGLLLILVGQTLIFTHWRPLSDWWFAFVWFGFILLVDAWIYQRDGRSLLMTRRRDVWIMLPASGVGWWFFEFANAFVHNWHYLQPADLLGWGAEIIKTACFTTVIPAEFEMAMLVWPTAFVQRSQGRCLWVPDRRIVQLLPIVGIGAFLLAALWPLYAFPLIWIFLVLVLDPINYRRGRPSILGYWASGDWRTPVALYLGGQLCGLLWEFWNYWAFPKWAYTIPWVGFWKVFEMPLLGYLGYGPFAWEIFALYHLVRGVLSARYIVPANNPVAEAESALEALGLHNSRSQ